MDVQGFQWWGWLLIGLVLIGAEILTPGLFLIFLGLAAVIVGALSAGGLLPAMWLQLLVFAVLSALSLVLFRRPLLARLRLAGTGSDDVDNLVGETAVALDELPAAGVGKVELRGSTWNARNAGTVTVARGERCTVEKVEGLTLVLRAAQVDSSAPAAASATSTSG